MQMLRWGPEMYIFCNVTFLIIKTKPLRKGAVATNFQMYRAFSGTSSSVRSVSEMKESAYVRYNSLRFEKFKLSFVRDFKANILVPLLLASHSQSFKHSYSDLFMFLLSVMPSIPPDLPTAVSLLRQTSYKG